MARDRARNWAAAACLVFVALAVFAAAPALAQVEARSGERYALVIGNSDYSHVEDLPNTARDAEAMAEALEALRFSVYKGIDLTAVEFERLVETFDRAAADADTVVFYYAGHGFQLGGLNHLAPIDAVLRDRARIDAETFALDDIVARIHRRQRQTIVFLDACRNNPLPASARDGTGSGLAQVGTGDGIFVAFATQPGNVSYDGTGKNSPFTEALLTHIGKPNRNISSLMIDVRNEVSDRTLGRQVPWDQSSLRADFQFNPGAPASQQVAAVEPGRGEPGRGGLVIGRPDDSAIRGQDDAEGAVPEAGIAPRQSPLTIGPAPMATPMAAPEATAPTGPATKPATVATPRMQSQTATAPVKPRARPEQMMAAVTTRATPDTVAPGSSARATFDTVAPAASARATPDKVAALATGAERPTVTAAPTTRAQAPTTVTRTAALARPATVTDAAGPAPVARLRPDREWFPDEAVPAEAEERKTAALSPVEPPVEEPGEPDEPLIDQQELARSIQGDLARLGCYRMSVDGVWGPGSRNSLAQFYREKGETASSLEPSTDVLAMLQDESGTVCEAPKTPKKPQIAAPPQKKKSPARAKAPPAPQRPTASAPPPPAAAPKTPKIIGF